MIKLYVMNGRAYVWNPESWFELRTIHRICGALIGSIASYPRQNDFLGLPLALHNEEAALLVEKGICELYESPSIINPPTEELKKTLQDIETRVQDEQREALRNKKKEQLSQKIDIIMEGKRKKMLSKGITDVHLDKETLIQEEISKQPPLATSQLLVHIPTEHYLETERTKVSIEVLEPSVSNGEGAIKYAVFKDLWEKGLYVTDGLKFGCDFLVYPGDPVKFHAMYMVRCVMDRKSAFPAAGLVAFGRLSVAVNKLAVLAYNNGGSISYQTLQWHESVNG